MNYTVNQHLNEMIYDWMKCMYNIGIKLTSKYGLKSVKKVISVDYFKEFYEKELRKREKRRREGVQR